MKIRNRMTLASALIGTSLALALYPSSPATAGVDDPRYAYPPNGWDHLCSPQSITLSPRPTSREYVASATCWINIAQDKTSDSSQDTQQWVQAQATMQGRYFLNNQKFHEAITVSMQGGPRTFAIDGSCVDDPWATPATCSADYTKAKQVMSVNFGWTFVYAGNTKIGDGPLSRILFDPAVIQAQIKKFESSPPVAPVGVEAVRWPAQGGKSDVGNISWRAGDMSGNKWVLMFDIEYSQYTDGTFTNAGHRVGPGPKQNMSAADANRVYVFSAPAALQSNTNYYFRVCASNDAGRQCSGPIEARKPTMQEKMARSGGMHVAAGGILAPSGGANTSGGGPKPGGPTPLGTNRPTGPIALGGARPGGTPGQGTGTNGSGGLSRAGGPPSTSIGGGKPGAPASTGAHAPGGIGAVRSIGPVAGVAPHPAGPGMAAIPDLALGRGIVVHGQPIAWGATANLTLRADATRACPLAMAFRYMNAGKGPATNVTAEIRDSQNMMQPVATQNLASLAAGQSSTVGGMLRVSAKPGPQRMVVVARVREAGRVHETDTGNDHGSVTLTVTCK